MAIIIEERSRFERSVPVDGNGNPETQIFEIARRHVEKNSGDEHDRR
jgi:hypothetical protein